MKKMRKGQSLVEVLIALSILTVGFLGMETLLAKSFFLNRVNTDETTGTYLASEGIEIAKNMLDHDTDAGLVWGTCGGSCTANVPTYYTADYTAQTFSAPSLNKCGGAPPLNFSTSTGVGLYSYSAGGKPSGFSRCIEITHTFASDGVTVAEVTVDSRVTWSTGPLTSQSIDLEDHFYNWHPPVGSGG